MNKKSKRILFVFGIALLAIIVTEIVRPKPLDWSDNYTATDKVPFGCYILSKEIGALFNNITITHIDEDPFIFLRDSLYKKNSLYFFVNTNVSFDKRQYKKLSNYVKSGNTAFISSRYFSNTLLDSLKIKTYIDYSFSEEELNPSFFNPSLKQDSLPDYKKGIYKSIFTKIDTLNTNALGYYINKKEPDNQINYIKVAHGKGFFYFHTLPEAFSNYYLMEGNQQYIANVLSYLNPSEIYWDGYLKSGRKIVASPMRFVLSQVSLKWAYYIIIIGLLLFVIFKGKRVQRVIKVIEPLENSSIRFTETIANLHFQQKDFENIIAKKITYFLEKIRSQYYLNTNSLNKEFCEKLSKKSGHTLDKTITLIDTIKLLKGKSFHNEKDLIYLNKIIEEYTL